MENQGKIEVINKSLDELLKNNYINKEDFEKLKLIYADDKRSVEEINDEISKFPINKKLLKEKLNESLNNKKENIDKTPSLSLENITDFEKEGKTYIKIHYPYPDDRVRVIENRTDPFRNAKVIFEELNNEFGNSTEGIEKAVSIFEDTLVKKCVETPLINYEEQKKYTEFNKLNYEQKQSFEGLQEVLFKNKNKFEGKIIRVCLEEKLVIISTPNEPSKDEIKTIKFNDMKKRYELVPVDSKGYKYEMDDNDNSLDDNNDVKEENISENNEEELQKEGQEDLLDKGYSYSKRRNNKRKRENN